MLDVGQPAPDFVLTDQFGRDIALSDSRGKWTLVWWIPSTMAEMTGSCTDRLAEGFSKTLTEVKHLVVIGMSFDSPRQMKHFAQRASVVFPLVSDEGRYLGDEYGVRRHDEWDCFPRKMSFLVDPNGYVVEVFRNIDADLHVAEVLEAIEKHEPAPQRSWLRRQLKV